MDLSEAHDGQRQRGKLMTAVVSTLLRPDNPALLALAAWGIKATGLSAWARCRASSEAPGASAAFGER